MQVLWTEGFEDVGRGPGFQPSQKVLFLALRADDDDRNLGKGSFLADLSKKPEAAHDGHVNVEEDEVAVGVEPEQIQRFATVRCVKDLDLAPEISPEDDLVESVEG